jgi:protein O-GlcNAc transferase
VTSGLEPLQHAAHLYQSGQFSQAEQICTQIVAAEPRNEVAWSLLGAIACDTSHYDRAIECFGAALALTPFEPLAHYNLGNALRIRGNLAEAISRYQQALQLNPQFAEAENNLGIAFQDQGQHGPAIAAFRRALALNPGFVAAHNNLGNALRDQGNLDQAVHCYHQALQLDPRSADVHNNLGTALKDRGELSAAPDAYRRAIELQPTFTTAWSNLLYSLYFCEDYNASAIYEEHRRFDSQLAAPLAPIIKSHLNSRDPKRRLRIGYVSPDFRHHCQAFFTLPLLAKHDHQNFEIFCYSDVVSPDRVTAQIQRHADSWRNIKGLPDTQVADLIGQDQIDILVDLTMHMAGGRPLLFARKPAPIQICWLAYPGTTGLSAMDYRLTDRYLDPPELNDTLSAEESIRLPESFWCYDPFGLELPINSLPAPTNGYVTFGSLNNFCKINPTVLRLWSRVLRSVDRSRLVILAPEGIARERTLEAFTQQGISSDRITFFAKQPLQQYLALYNSIDIGLDTIPANGHTTSLDSLWMGVPVVTMVGRTAIGRGGFSQLSNLGLAELISTSPDEFVAVASQLAADLPRLAMLRAGLRERLRNSPLMNATSFARNVETAFRQIWQRWCSR